MAVWSSITTSKMEYTRIDADYYHPDYLAEMVLWRKLKEQNNVSKLRHLIRAPVRTGRTPSSRAIKDGELCIPFIKTDTLREGSVNFNNSDFLPARVLSNNDYIPKDSVVITIIGATLEIVGRAAIVRPEDPDCVTNQNVAVVCTNEKCDPYYLTAFFQTKIGRDQLWRHSRRTEQVNLNCREVERVLVPLLTKGQQEIGDLVRASFQSSDHSIELYNQAQHFLESELGLDKLTFKKPVGYTARFSTVGLSDALHAGRIDAQCFSPSAVFYESWLREHNQCDPLNHLLEAKVKGRQQEEMEKGSTDYCSIKHISGHELTGASKCLPSADTPLATQNNLLLAITGATIGKIGIVKRYKQLAFSGDLLCLKIAPGIDPHYLLVALDHTIGQVQFNRWITGSTNGHLAPRDVGKVLVPRFKDSAETRIAELVEESLRKRLESERLLEQAKTRVEQLIEEAAAKQGEGK